ncbi:hypothetical protein HQ447_11520 [bacterium]|nr:hypothetical protein [bacterium]
MKTNIRKLTLCALLGVSISAHAAPVLIPNGDFATAGGSDFGFFESAPGVVSFPATGGSGDNGGYGLVNNTLGSWGGGLVSPSDFLYPGNTGIPLANLGLTAGQTYTFSMDMKNFAGTGTGGLKLEGWNTGNISNTGDVAASASSNQWATYTWNYTIPANATSIKIVPLLTGASGGSTADSVGFDNIKVNNTPVAPPPFVALQIPNGDFEIPGGASWAYYTDGFGLDWATTGGNPGGNAVINGTTGGGYAVLVAFSNAEKTAASLGLTPGGPCTIQMDMKIVSGTNVGGLKLEGPAGFGPVIEPAPLSGVGVWATYTFNFTLQNGLNPVSQFKIVPLGKGGSIVAYDNIKIVLPLPPVPPQPSIIIGKMVNWTPTVATNYYQPQKSSDNIAFTNLGSAFVGTEGSSVFDPSPAAFYRVQESAPVLVNAALNGGFEEPFFDGADLWTEFGNFAPLRITMDFHTGTACMRLNPIGSAAAAVSGLEQNILNQGGSITPGSNYTLSLWKKQVSVADGYVQQFRVVYLNGNAEVSATGWTAIPTGNIGTWTQMTLSNQVAPANATTALIQVQAVTGGFVGSFGEVLIDDVSLETTVTGTPSTIASTSASAAEISWQSVTGQTYQLRSSSDLSGWTPLGAAITGNNSLKAMYDTPLVTKKFYQLGTQ